MNNQLKPWQTRAIGLLFAGIGLVLLTISGITLTRQLRFQAAAQTTVGTVVDVQMRSGGDDGPTYIPTVQFKDVEGVTHAAKPNGSASWWNFREGSEVEVQYLPERPERIRFTDFESRWLVPLRPASWAWASQRSDRS